MKKRQVWRRITLVLVTLLAGALLAEPAGAASLEGLGGWFFFSEARGVSADGEVVVGIYETFGGKREAFRWTWAGGMVDLGFLPGGIRSEAWGASADGSVVVGWSSDPTFINQAFRWTEAGGMVGLGVLHGGYWSRAQGVSADGSVVVGTADSSEWHTEAFIWTEADGMVGLGVLPGISDTSEAYAVSADGSVVVGQTGTQAFRWTEKGGMVGLGDLWGGTFFSTAYAVSANGSVVVGAGKSSSGIEAFRWTEKSGMVGLGVLPGASSSTAYGVSADGAVVVGSCDISGDDVPFIWDTTNGMQNLQELLVSYGLGDYFTDYKLTEAYDISADGRTIVGDGDFAPVGEVAYRAVLWTFPEPEPLDIFPYFTGAEGARWTYAYNTALYSPTPSPFTVNQTLWTEGSDTEKYRIGDYVYPDGNYYWQIVSADDQNIYIWEDQSGPYTPDPWTVPGTISPDEIISNPFPRPEGDLAYYTTDDKVATPAGIYNDLLVYIILNTSYPRNQANVMMENLYELPYSSYAVTALSIYGRDVGLLIYRYFYPTTGTLVSEYNITGTNLSQSNYSRYYFNFNYNDGSGDYYGGYVYAPTWFKKTDDPDNHGWLEVGTKLYDQPMEFWDSGYKSFNGGYYEIIRITDGFDSSYDKKSYIIAYYDEDTAQAILGVNSDGSATPDNIYVPDRTVSWEEGYAISGTTNDTFSVYEEADVPFAAPASYAAAMPSNSTSNSVYEEAEANVPVALVSYGTGMPVNSSSGLLDEDK